MNKHTFGQTILKKKGAPTVFAPRIRAGDPLSANVHVACKSCNSGWMSGIQDAAKPFLIPLFKGQATVLGEKAQVAIATWAAMATMTGEYISRDPTQVAVPQTDRNHLRSNLQIPPDWRVWIGCYKRKEWKGQWAHATVPILDSNTAKAVQGFHKPNTQASTFVLGDLFVHTMSCEFREFARDWHWRTMPEVNRLLLPIWPVRNSIVAWPFNQLSDCQAHDCAGAFTNAVHAIGVRHGF